MTTKPNKAATFLANMNLGTPEAEAAPANPDIRPKRVANESPQPVGKSAAARRASQKHIGGYFDSDSDTVEKVALLRARLKLDNSELIKLAIDELFTKQKAARAFSNN